ncbi:MAG: SagB/ThcOx family dehydrogenase [bacterium]|nr:SagB/ThcOx family dehydrogenase [bacterium]
MDRLQFVLQYHHETKHHPYRYARSLGYLDWANQPHPFRSYEGVERKELPFPPDAHPISYSSLFIPGAVPAKKLTPDSLAEFFRHALGLSAWKGVGGDRWALRVNPSSGNLHPTEGYAILDPLFGLFEKSTIVHYTPQTHALETRGEFPPGFSLWPEQGRQAQGFLVGLTSIHWREAWKYGERAFRYCQHDTGHALAALRLSAALQGWGMEILPQWSTEDLTALMGVNRLGEINPEEREEPECLALVWTTPTAAMDTAGLREKIKASLDRIRWYGRANRLSEEHQPWPLIDQVADATRQPSRETLVNATREGNSTPIQSGVSAKRIILQRRSAQAFDPNKTLTLRQCIAILEKAQHGPHAPWDSLFWPPQIHLVLFVHRVQGLVPGMYALLRWEEDPDDFPLACHPHFLWERPSCIDASLPLYLLEPGDFQNSAAGISCGQAIAGDSYFSLGMIARFTPALQYHGPWFYHCLFWEAGLIGQMLYLEAEHQGARGTGIGCYFDDAMHHILGLKDAAWQSMYHFTIGYPLQDERLRSIPPYERETFDPSLFHPFS